MGLLPNQGYSSGGSINNAQSLSQTMGTAASERAINTTTATNTSAHNAWLEAAKYNEEQARINREWQERMANTVYQRTVEDMRKAGINPVLAAGMGLGSAGVGGGSAASISPSEVYNAQTFADSMSASQSHGSSWNQSENGLITFAEALTSLGKSLIESITSSKTIQLSIEGLQQGWQDFTNKNNAIKENRSKKFWDTLYKLTGGRVGEKRGYDGTGFSSGGSKF